MKDITNFKQLIFNKFKSYADKVQKNIDNEIAEIASDTNSRNVLRSTFTTASVYGVVNTYTLDLVSNVLEYIKELQEDLNINLSSSQIDIIRDSLIEKSIEQALKFYDDSTDKLLSWNTLEIDRIKKSFYTKLTNDFKKEINITIDNLILTNKLKRDEKAIRLSRQANVISGFSFIVAAISLIIVIYIEFCK